MEFSSTDGDGQVIRFRDGKRYFWWLPLIIGIITGGTVAAYFTLDHALWTTFIPVIYFFALIPIIDALIGEDSSNPPEAVFPAMAADPYYRRVLLFCIPVYYISFFLGAWFVATQDLPVWAYLVFALGLGVLHGNALTMGHELGHKSDRLDRWAAKIILALVGYAHFSIEHNRGHHVWVATPEDPASARMGESIYRFALREIPGGLKRGLAHEKERLERKGLPFWSVKNEILQGYFLTIIVAALAILLFGWKAAPFILIHHFSGYYALTQANYVEHYGLKRGKKPNGKYQPCEPHHSWNTNHLVSNLLTFHLQRHSDHHVNPLRPYQILRDFPDLPRLPSGYPGCFALAAIPPLWFRVMDPKVMEWAGGNFERVNIAPDKEADLMAKYPGLSASHR